MSSAIEGEGGAYVPCDELPAPLPAVPEGAIVGSGVGFVSKDMLASPFPDDPTGAITGSGVGFVAKECECCCDTFTRVVAIGGGPSEICPHPEWLPGSSGSGVVDAAASVDGSAMTLAWADPTPLIAAQYILLSFTGPPVEYHTRIKASASNDAAIFLSNQEFYNQNSVSSSWKVDVLGLDLRITVDGPDGGAAQATLAGAFPAFDTYMDVYVLCEERTMKIRAQIGEGVSDWQATAGPYSVLFAPCSSPTLIEYLGGTFLGSGLDDTFTVDKLCILQGYDC